MIKVRKKSFSRSPEVKLGFREHSIFAEASRGQGADVWNALKRVLSYVSEVTIINNAFSSHLFSVSEICRERRDPRFCKFMTNLMPALTEMKPQNINKFFAGGNRDSDNVLTSVASEYSFSNDTRIFSFSPSI